jgi:DNA polymerase IV
VCEHTFVQSGFPDLTDPPAPAAATILHADLDAFFASVEQRDDPRLRGRPVVVGAGVVMAASYEARAYGVRGAMGAAQARRLCPQAVVVAPRMTAYAEASRAVFAVFDDTTPLVEALSIDEAFLDVGGLRRVSGAPADIAAQLRRAVWERVGLRITVGVARTKFLAKVASGVAKPDGLLVVAPEAEMAFLYPLAVERLWGVGEKTAGKLRELGITTVGEVARLTELSLVSMLGPAAGRKLHALARNRDPRPVRAAPRRRSMGAQRALGRAARPEAEIDAILGGLVDGIAHRLREGHRVGRTVVLRLRFDDYSRVTRSRTIPQPTAETQPIRDTARELLTAARPAIRERGLTLIGVAVTNLDDDDAVQLELPLDRATGGALDRALDDVRNRFGASMVSRAALLGRERGWSMPLLPDGQPSSQPS